MPQTYALVNPISLIVDKPQHPAQVVAIDVIHAVELLQESDFFE
jgi:hypothetical protein